jgi:hypothetical protein
MDLQNKVLKADPTPGVAWLGDPEPKPRPDYPDIIEY